MSSYLDLGISGLMLIKYNIPDMKIFVSSFFYSNWSNQHDI